MAWDYPWEITMKTVSVKVVRVYLTESSGLLTQLVRYLREEIEIRGITVFRGISGFGDSGEHNVSLLSLAMDLPIVLEFFDSADKVKLALAYLSDYVEKEHILVFDAKANA